MARQAWKNRFDGPDGRGLVILKLPLGISDQKALKIAEQEQDAEMDPDVRVVPMIGEPDAEPGLFGSPAVVRWIKANLQKLIGEGYTTLFVDGGTELSRMLEVAFTTPNAESIMGDSDNGKRNRLLTLVPDITGFAGRTLEMSDYGMMYLRFKAALDVTKSLPFVLIWSFLEGQAYDEKDTNIKTGAGPDAVGRKLPGHIPSWFDACFHCERNPGGEFVWLTSNDPKLASSSSPYRAKHRFGRKLKDVEPADGDRLLNKLGIFSPKPT